MSGSIFISYRREDTQHAAARFSDRLEHEFSRERVFFDVETLPAGVDFVEEVAKKIDACDAFVVMIGKSWLEVRDTEGGRRLDNPDDHVRVEIVRALDAKKRVFPVLVDGATMPPRKNLPDALKPLTQRNAVKLSHESFRADCDRLVNLLKDALTGVEQDRQAAGKAAEEAELAAKQIADQRRLQEAEDAERRRQELEAEPRRREEDERKDGGATPLAAASIWREPMAKAGLAASPPQVEVQTGLMQQAKDARLEQARPGENQGATERNLGETRSSAPPQLAPGRETFDGEVDGASKRSALPAKPHRISRRVVLGGVAVAVAVGGIWAAGILSRTRRLDARLVLEGHTNMISDAAFDLSGALISTASVDTTARIWLSSNGKSQALEGHSSSVTHALIAPREPKVVVLTTSDDRTARLWSFWPDFKQQVTLPHPDFVLGAAWSPDGQTALTGGGNNPRLWSRAGKLLGEPQGHKSEISFAAFSRDGRFFVTAALDGTVNIWAAREARLVVAFAGPQSPCRSADFSPDGESLVAAYIDGTVMQWRNWKLGPGSEPLARTSGITTTTARYSPDGEKIVAASRDQTAVIYAAIMGWSLVRLEGHSADLSSAQFSPDGRLVATASGDHTAMLWDAATGKPLAVLDGHTGYVLGAAFSPDGKQVLTWSSDATARLWDVPGDILA